MERDKIRRANWERYWRILGGENISVGDAINSRELNTVNEAWIRAVREAGRETIPKKTKSFRTTKRTIILDYYR